MSYKYCTCGAKIAYEYEAPTKCPKCGINFADAFRKTVSEKPISATQVIRTDIEDDDYEIIRVKKKKHIQAKIEDIEEDFSNDDVDLDEVENYSREIAASINENDFIVNYGVEEPQKLGQFLPKKE